MRNWAIGLVALALLAGLPQLSEAGGFGTYARRVGLKTAHAFADIGYAPAELFLNPVTHAVDFDRHNRSSGHGLWLGALVGVVKTSSRFGRGFSDLLTFPIPSERHDRWRWEWSFLGFQHPISEPTQRSIEDAR